MSFINFYQRPQFYYTYNTQNCNALWVLQLPQYNVLVPLFVQEFLGVRLHLHMISVYTMKKSSTWQSFSHSYLKVRPGSKTYKPWTHRKLLILLRKFTISADWTARNWYNCNKPIKLPSKIRIINLIILLIFFPCCYVLLAETSEILFYSNCSFLCF